MKKLIMILTMAISGCNSQVKTEQQAKEIENEERDTLPAVQVNKESKWKADEATKKNVAAIVQAINDSSYAGAAKKNQLYVNLQTKIDTLVNQCNMQGAEHDALHAWLKKVLKDMKELKDGDDGYSEAYATLKKDIESFYAFFE